MKGIGSMKRLVMAMSALLVSVTMSFAQESSLHKEPFVVNVLLVRQQYDRVRHSAFCFAPS